MLEIYGFRSISNRDYHESSDCLSLSFQIDFINTVVMIYMIFDATLVIFVNLFIAAVHKYIASAFSIAELYPVRSATRDA